MWGSSPPYARGPMSGLHGLRVAVAKPALRSYLVADELLQFFDVGEPAMLLARPEQLAVEAYFEHAACLVRNERHRAELLGERGQELLRHPRRTEQPAAQPAIGDRDVRVGSVTANHAHIIPYYKDKGPSLNEWRGAI